MTSALLILTGAQVWTMKDGTPHPTGFWAREFVEAYSVFADAGLDVSIATPRGVEPVPDELGYLPAYNDDDDDAIAAQKAFIASHAGELSSTVDLDTVEPGTYDVLFIVGGHGPMQDLAVHPTLGRLLAGNLEDPRRFVGAVCHGSAGFLSAQDSDGNWLFKGRRLTGFTNEEETMATFAGNAPWLLEDRLRLSGALFEPGPAYKAHVVVDGNLVTGQQNVSSGAAATAIVGQLRSTDDPGGA